MKKYLFPLIVFLASNCLASVTVSVSSPGNGADVATPFTVNASARSGYTITGWHLYLDGNDVYKGGQTGSISPSVNASTGSHTLVVRAWDSSGAYGDQTVSVTVNGDNNGNGNGLPTPPGNALVYNNLDQQNNGWNKCGDPGCAGGSGKGTYWQSFYQSSPSMDGSSMQLYRDGIWANALWWKKVGAQNGVTNFLWDFYVRVDNTSTTAGQALEYDAFQFVGGYNYMMGTQCDYGRGVWDIWNGTGGSWAPTNIPCPKFSPNTWHHIQWYMRTNHSNHSYTFVTLVVDGKPYTLNKTMYAKYLAWGDNIGAQWQLDVNKTGAGFHEWVDKAKLTVW
ncbi:MAG: hypothetical protein ACXVZV_02710 [Terriglobales bacterium]